MTLKDRLILMLLNTVHAIIIDISKWQAWFDLDAPGVMADILTAIDGIIIRIGYANAWGIYKDPKAESYYAEMEQHPEPVRGLYFYFSPFQPWENQVAKFLEWIKEKSFDFILWDVEEQPTTEALWASYSITGIRALKTLQRAYPNKRVIVYTRKDIYIKLRKYSAEWDNWPYHHAQYPFGTWAILSEWILTILGKIISGKGTPDLPPSRNGRYTLRQFGDKTGLGKEFGVGSNNIDINVTRETRADFIRWLGTRETPQPEPVPDPITPEDAAGLIIDGLPDNLKATVKVIVKLESI